MKHLGHFDLGCAVLSHEIGLKAFEAALLILCLLWSDNLIASEDLLHGFMLEERKCAPSIYQALYIRTKRKKEQQAATPNLCGDVTSYTVHFCREDEKYRLTGIFLFLAFEPECDV